MTSDDAHRPLAPPAALMFAAGALVVGVVYALVQRRAGGARHLRTRTNELMNSALSYAVGMLVWPLAWYALVGPAVIRAAPLTLVGFCWPVAIMALDLLWVTKQPLEPEDSRKTTFTFDGNAISSLSFALGGVLLSQVGRTFASSAAPMLSACIFLVIGFVIPSPGVHTRTGIGSIILALKKVAMAFCVGLLISSIAISLQKGLQRRRLEVTHDKLLADKPDEKGHAPQLRPSDGRAA